MKKQLLILGLFGIFFLSSCGSKEETIKLTKDNYNDYIKLYTSVSEPTREDGTVISGTKKIYSDTQAKYYVRCEPKDNVKINSIDVSVEVKMQIYYYKEDPYMYLLTDENITLACSDIVFNEYVTSYSYVYKKENLYNVFGWGYNLDYIYGTVTISK